MIFKIFIIILISILILGSWSFFVEPRRIKIENIRIKIKNLSRSFQGIKIVQLSDLHSKDFGEKEKKSLEILAQLKPDFIFITGDFIDWKTSNLKSCQEFWKEISKNYPNKVFGVFGNHENHHPKSKTIKNLLTDSGVKIINNESVILRKNEDFIYLVGVDDPHENHDDIIKAMEQVENDAPKIMLAHSPEIFRRVKGQNIDLILTGHTHAGQINTPFITNLFLPVKYDRKYKSGLFKEDSTYLYVNRGVGTTLLPFRFNAPPEITLIELE